MEHLNLINILTYVRQRLDELLSFTVMSVSLNCDELLAEGGQLHALDRVHEQQPIGQV